MPEYKEKTEQTKKKESLPEDAVEEMKRDLGEDMPDDEILYDMAELFKVFGDTTRIKILYLLFTSELCVYDIAKKLDMSQSAISHQLRVLKQARLVRYKREGKSMIYGLADDHIRTMFNQGLEHVLE